MSVTVLLHVFTTWMLYFQGSDFVLFFSTIGTVRLLLWKGHGEQNRQSLGV